MRTLERKKKRETAEGKGEDDKRGVGGKGREEVTKVNLGGGTGREGSLGTGGNAQMGGGRTQPPHAPHQLLLPQGGGDSVPHVPHELSPEMAW